MSSREKILSKLRAVRQPFTDVPPVEERRHMVPIQDAPPEQLYDRFIAEAKKLKCQIYETNSPSDALEEVLNIIGADKSVLAWDAEYIPLPGLDDAFNAGGIERAALRDETVRVGLTGVDAAVASTGSLVLKSGSGKSRQASLLPIEHISVVQKSQIIPDLETFFAGEQRHTGLSDHSNLAIISGPSKSADIAMEMILGMHGPGKVHIVIVP